MQVRESLRPLAGLEDLQTMRFGCLMASDDGMHGHCSSVDLVCYSSARSAKKALATPIALYAKARHSTLWTTAASPPVLVTYGRLERGLAVPGRGCPAVLASFRSLKSKFLLGSEST